MIDANELAQKMLEKAALCDEMAMNRHIRSDFHERYRLRGKAEGLRLAHSYIQDAIKTDSTIDELRSWANELENQ